MNYEHIETFLCVVTCKNISAAAKALYISQSTVSARIQQLEAELGVSLLIRKKGHHTISLTSYGNSFISIARQWAALWQEAQALKHVSDIRQITIASVDAVNNYTLAPLFASHALMHPNIRLTINTYHSGEIYRLVESLDADIGFVFSRMSYPDVVIKPIYRELMYLICHKDSIYGDEVACEDLDVRQQIMLIWGNDFLQWHHSHWNPDEPPLLTVNTGSMLQRYLTIPDRWAVAPMSVVSDAIRNNSDLVFYTLKTPPPPRICYEVTNRFASEPRRKGIRIIDEELNDFINQNPSICRFETWMLNNGSYKSSNF